MAELYASRLAVVSIRIIVERMHPQEKLIGLQWNQLGKSSPTLILAYRINGIMC